MSEETTVQPEGEASGTGASDLEAVRGLILRAHPDVVPDLIAGDSIPSLMAAIEPARAAYQRVSERVRAAAAPASPAVPPAVPAGSATAVVDPARLPAGELIRRGIAGRAASR